MNESARARRAVDSDSRERPPTHVKHGRLFPLWCRCRLPELSRDGKDGQQGEPDPEAPEQEAEEDGGTEHGRGDHVEVGSVRVQGCVAREEFGGDDALSGGMSFFFGYAREKGLQ